MCFNISVECVEVQKLRLLNSYSLLINGHFYFYSMGPVSWKVVTLGAGVSPELIQNLRPGLKLGPFMKQYCMQKFFIEK